MRLSLYLAVLVSLLLQNPELTLDADGKLIVIWVGLLLLARAFWMEITGGYKS